MTGTIWSPDGPITSTANADNSYKAQRYIATEGQTIFTLTEFAYAVGTGSLLVYINGVDQFIVTDFLETDSTHVTFVTPLEVGDVVVIRGVVGTTGAQAAQASADAAAASVLEAQAVVDAGILAAEEQVQLAADQVALATVQANNAEDSADNSEAAYQAILALSLPSLPLAINLGGTGQTTKDLAFKALAPTPVANKVIGSSDGVNFSMVDKGGVTLVRVNRSSNVMLTAADNSKYFICSGNFTQTFDTPANLGSGWFCHIKNSSNGVITTDGYVMYPNEERRFDSDGTTLRSIVITPFFMTGTASTAFYRPPGYSAFGGLLFGGGASGGARRTWAAGNVVDGGGSAACTPIWYPNASMPASVSYTIGAGGLAVSPSSGASLNGNDGGNSVFGSFTAYGGKAGGGLGTAGAGVLSKSFSDPTYGVPIGGAPAGGHYKMIFTSRTDPAPDSTYGGGGSGELRSDSAATAIFKGGNSIYGGTGSAGAYGNGTDYTTSGAAGNTMYGGVVGQGAVAGASAATILLNIGTSIYGGTGGTASIGTGVRTGTTGGVRGGGGGAAVSTDNSATTSGAGGRGELQLWGII